MDGGEKGDVGVRVCLYLYVVVGGLERGRGSKGGRAGTCMVHMSCQSSSCSLNLPCRKRLPEGCHQTGSSHSCGTAGLHEGQSCDRTGRPALRLRLWRYGPEPRGAICCWPRSSWTGFRSWFLPAATRDMAQVLLSTSASTSCASHHRLEYSRDYGQALSS